MPAVGEVKPVDEIVAETRTILEAARRDQVPLRAIGGLAIRLRAGHERHTNLERSYRDIDLFAPKKSQASVSALLEGLGYAPDRHFNAAHGDRRLLFLDSSGSHIDVFVGVFELCHVIPISADRAAMDPLTLPLAELLLTKLQIVQLNEKDQQDIVTLFYHYDVGADDADMINGDLVARILAGDWGLWRTSTGNLDRTAASVDRYQLDADGRALVHERIDRLRGQIGAEPKSRKWKMRARIGERKRWYEEPEEEPEA